MKPVKVLYDICRHYLNDQRAAVSPQLWSLVDGLHRARDHRRLSACSCHFDWQRHSVDDWRFLRQVEAFYKKNSLFAHEETCIENARESFAKAEETCAQTNRSLRAYIGHNRLIGEEYGTYVLRMQRYIDSVLGDFRPFLDALPSLVKVTSGATSTSSRRESLPQLKLRMRLFCTRAAAPFVRSVGHIFGFQNLRTKVTHSNRVELVPKNWKTHRTIACEPEGNLPFQLAFDTYAKRRLRRRGINLRDQSANQRAAKLASVQDNLVTVDFSKASDTISYNTVSLLFPVDWFNYLDQVRTPCYRGVFGEGIYHKFSSMGNGSTFTVETLIFAAACYAVGSSNFLVYGDDVVIEKEFYEQYLRLTRFLGFTINEDKTFSSGPFRESCGKDYFNGVDVTPVYVRNIDKRKAFLCHLVNTLACIACPCGSLRKYLTDLASEFELPFVPYNESTLSGIWIDPDTARRLGILKRKNSIDFFRAYNANYSRRSFVDSRGYYLWFLNKNSQVLFSGPWAFASNVSNFDQTETSWAPVFEHKYVRKRVVWFPPHDGTLPGHLYWWSDTIVPPK